MSEFAVHFPTLLLLGFIITFCISPSETTTYSSKYDAWKACVQEELFYKCSDGQGKAPGIYSDEEREALPLWDCGIFSIYKKKYRCTSSNPDSELMDVSEAEALEECTDYTWWTSKYTCL